MLEFSILEVTCEGNILRKTKEYRFRIICEGSVKQISVDDVKSQWIKPSGGKVDWVPAKRLKFTLAEDSKSDVHGVVISLERYRRSRTKNEEIGRCGLKCVAIESQGKEPLSLSMAGKTIDAMVTVKIDITRPQATDVAAGISFVEKSTKKIAEKGETWSALSSRLDRLMELGTRLAELNPIAKLAWGVVKMGYDVVSGQIERDKKLTELVEAMSCACSFAEQGERLDSYPSNHRTIVSQILQQVVECTYFVRAYCEDSFGNRVLNNISSDDAGKQMDEYKANLSTLQSALNTMSIIECKVVVHRVFDEVEGMRHAFNEHDMRTVLDDLSYAKGARPDIQQGCLPGTRVEVINEIVGWGAQATPQSVSGGFPENALAYKEKSRVLWICGVSGSGKSSIARTVAAHLQDRLGSFYAFDITRQTKLNPNNLFSTIARNLADNDPVRKRSLVEAIQDDTALRKSQNVSEQFESFIVAPSSRLTGIGDTVIVIDAFDESGDVASRRTLLSILTTRASEIPSGLKFIVTSRFESDVQEALKSEVRPASVDLFFLDNVSEDSTSRDITKFMYHTLGDIGQLKRHRGDIDSLAVKAEHSFQWASTACRYILAVDDGDGGSLRQRMKRVLDGKHGLDNLYSLILDRRFKSADSDTLAQLRTFTGLMVCAMEPLPLRALITLSVNHNTPSEDDIDDYQQMAHCLGSLLSGVHDLDTIVKPLHSSFIDFLCNKARSGQYSVDLIEIRNRFARRCLEIMIKGGLKFNICDFPTSFLQNTKINNLDKTIHARISPQLSYSCRYWPHHISELHTSDLGFVESLLCSLLHDQFLYWLEVMSLVRSNPYTALSKVSTNITSLPYCAEVKVLLEEAIQFTSTFLTPIMESVPHIYLSCLPFVPTSSHLPKNLSKYSNLAQVKTGRKTSWRSHVTVFEGHSGAVVCVAHSPKAPLIASGSWDKTIRLWNYRTGDSIVLRKHTNRVRCITFSPGGKHLVSGSHDRGVILWDIETGLPVWRNLHGNANGVMSVAFSPTGHCIASGSDDRTIQLWDARSGKLIGSPLEGHGYDIISLSFSFDGTQLVSGDMNRSIRIWDVRTHTLVKGITSPSYFSRAVFSPDSSHILVAMKDNILRIDSTEGSVIGDPFGKHDSDINSISLSPPDPDGHHVLVSCSKDHSIRSWDPSNGVECRPRLHGHTESVTSVAYSPDGKFVVSGSNDKTVRLWRCHHDISEQEESPPEQHIDVVRAVVYSPDRLHVATGSDDCTVRIWRVQDGKLVGKLEGVHTHGIMSIAYSPDGSQLVTSSRDKTISQWDVEKLKPIGLPWFGHTNLVSSIAFSPSGTALVSASYDQTVGLWDMTVTPPAAQFLKAHSMDVKSVAFSSKGTTFASASKDRIIIWDLKTARPIGKHIQIDNSYFLSIAYSPDGSKLAAASGQKITTWDVESRNMQGQALVGHQGLISSLSYSPSGRYLASGSNDRTLRIWDTKQNVMLGRPLRGHRSSVYGVSFSLDGAQIASVSRDNTVRVWDAQIGYDSDDLEKVAQRNNQYPPSLFPEHDFRIQNDGWIVDSDGNLLLWIPYEFRVELRGPNVRILNNRDNVELNFQYFKCGTEWTQCYPDS